MGNSVTVKGPSFRVAIRAPVYWKAHIRLTKTSSRKYHVERRPRRTPLSFISISFSGPGVSGVGMHHGNIGQGRATKVS
jgi:hypothetical protein